MTAVQGRRRRGTGHELRDVILQVTTDLLAQLGDIDALTMRAVSTAAGVSPPSVYRHFPDKATLVRAVIATRFAEFAAAIDVPAQADPLARLEAMAAAYLRWGLSRPGHYRLLFSATNAGPASLGLDEGTEHPGAPTFRSLVAAVSACLPATATETTAFPLATELWSSLHGIVDLRITKPEHPWPDPEALLSPALAAIRAATNPDS